SSPLSSSVQNVSSGPKIGSRPVQLGYRNAVTASELAIDAEPGPPWPLSESIGGPATPLVPPESCDHWTSTPSKPAQPILPDAELPAPCTKLQGGLPAAAHTLSPAVKRGEQSVDGVTPSTSKSVPPHVFAATARIQVHP